MIERPVSNDPPPQPAGPEEIRIPRLRLKDRVLIEGIGPRGQFVDKAANFLNPGGEKAAIWLNPTDEPGWYWKKKDGTRIPIDMNMVKEGTLDVHARHYLYFEDGNEKLKVVEHLLALRFLGIDAVEIEVAEDAGEWVPYGRAEQYWQAIEPHLKYDGLLKPAKLKVSDSYTSIDKAGRTRTVSLDTTTDPKNPAFVVTVKIDYPQFKGNLPEGTHEITHRFPLSQPSDAADMLASRALLQPAWLEPILALAYKAGIWPHFGDVLKPSDFDPEDPTPYLREIALHRLVDFLGALAVTMEAGEYLTGKASTERGGHIVDLGLLKKIAAEMSA